MNREEIEALVGAALKEADATFGYDMKLVRLVDGESTYRLKVMDLPPTEHSGTDECYEQIAVEKSRHRAKAVIDALSSLPLLEGTGPLPPRPDLAIGALKVALGTTTDPDVTPWLLTALAFLSGEYEPLEDLGSLGPKESALHAEAEAGREPSGGAS